MHIKLSAFFVVTFCLFRLTFFSVLLFSFQKDLLINNYFCPLYYAFYVFDRGSSELDLKIGKNMMEISNTLNVSIRFLRLKFIEISASPMSNLNIELNRLEINVTIFI